MLGDDMVEKRNKEAESRAETYGTAGRGSGNEGSSPRGKGLEEEHHCISIESLFYDIFWAS